MWFFLFLFGFLANADMYLQYPMGSNNRLDDENRDRNNANRLMDTQNNNRGGFNVGNVFFFAGTEIPMKWTSQHSCGNPNNNCEIIIQMMCDQRLRDGTTQSTIPENPIECYNWDCDTDVRYGRHESFTSYKTCKSTQRNKGLFLADQNVKGNIATYTRQNPNGARRGYECPEERDYYPYWRPTEWVDVAYFTNDMNKCAEVLKQSENVKPRFSCYIAEKYLYMKNSFNNNKPIPITQAGCENLKITVPKMENGENVLNTLGKPVMEERSPGVWRKANYTKLNNVLKAAIGAPTCTGNTWARDNHHGNVKGGDFAGWNWKVPVVPANFPLENCVLRIRYNISTTDLPAFTDTLTTPDILKKVSDGNGGLIDELDLQGRYYVGMQMGFNKTETDMSGYYFKNNPQVAPFYNYPTPDAMKINGGDQFKLQLAINTAQFGRTFQDRTHRFSIKPKPAQAKGANIRHLGVRGKRGNIVQTYPGTEYSFQPEKLETQVGDLIHIQWVGSNTNPNNNAGQGRQGSDRHNIVTMRSKRYDEAGQTNTFENLKVYGQLGGSYPAGIKEGHPEFQEFLGLGKAMREKLAILKGINTNGGELSELDDAGTWAGFGLIRVTMEGIYNYLCTRNNNFSNRSQKGIIVARTQGNFVATTETSFSGAELQQGQSTLKIGMGSTSKAVVEMQVVGHKNSGWCNPCGSDYVLLPNDLPVTQQGNSLTLKYEDKAHLTPRVFHTTSGTISAKTPQWNEIKNAECGGGSCTFPVSAKGIYVVDGQTSWWVYLLSILGGCLVVGSIGFFACKILKPGA